MFRISSTLLLVLVSAFTLACCSVSPLLQVAAVKKPAFMIIERHDAYVKADASLSQDDVVKCLSESAKLKTILETKTQVRQSEIQSLALAICVRHDQYVNADESLDELHRRTYLRSTTILLEVIAAGK